MFWSFFWTIALWSATTTASLHLWKYIKRRTRNHLQTHFHQTLEDWSLYFDELSSDATASLKDASKDDSKDASNNAVPAERPAEQAGEQADATSVVAEPEPKTLIHVEGKVESKRPDTDAVALPLRVILISVPDELLEKLVGLYVSKFHQRIMIASLSVSFVMYYVIDLFWIPTAISFGYNALAIYEHFSLSTHRNSMTSRNNSHLSWLDNLPLSVKTLPVYEVVQKVLTSGPINYFNALPSEVKHHSVTLCTLLLCTLPWSWSSMISQTASNAFLFAYFLLECSNYALYPTYVLVKKLDFASKFVTLSNEADNVLKAYRHKLLLAIRDLTNEQMISVSVTRMFVMPIFWFISNVVMMRELSLLGHLLYLCLSSMLILVGPIWFKKCFDSMAQYNVSINKYRSTLVEQSRSLSMCDNSNILTNANNATNSNVLTNANNAPGLTNANNGSNLNVSINTNKIDHWAATVQLEYFDALLASQESTLIIDLLVDAAMHMSHLPQDILGVVDRVTTKYWSHVKPE